MCTIVHDSPVFIILIESLQMQKFSINETENINNKNRFLRFKWAGASNHARVSTHAQTSVKSDNF